MSCGSRTFTATDFPNALETARHAPRYRRAFLDKKRRRQFWLELEKAQRRLLKDLGGRLPADIGITREQVEREARKPFWH
jgi:uncharacterized protein YjiS (DUF1127 family)